MFRIWCSGSSRCIFEHGLTKLLVLFFTSKYQVVTFYRFLCNWRVLSNLTNSFKYIAPFLFLQKEKQGFYPILPYKARGATLPYLGSHFGECIIRQYARTYVPVVVTFTCLCTERELNFPYYPASSAIYLLISSRPFGLFIFFLRLCACFLCISGKAYCSPILGRCFAAMLTASLYIINLRKASEDSRNRESRARLLS